MSRRMLVGMGYGPLVYKAEDRSILLPFYRRYFVDPFLPYLPAHLSPNTITHAGHLLNLFGSALLITIWPRHGWPFAAAAMFLQAYIWCDNADGAHARRTGQCSGFGELLDHGLDILNVLYISYLTAMALGAPPLWWVLIVLLISGAGSVTYWEQTQTGVFRLGMMNQIESGVVLSLALLASATLGTAAWETPLPFGLTVRLVVLLWVLTTILFGMVRGMMRVARVDGLGPVVPVLALVLFGSLLAGAAAWGLVTTVAAVMMATAVNLFFSARMLLHRLRKQPPRIEPGLLIGSGLLGGLLIWHLTSHSTSFAPGTALAALTCAVFGGQAVLDAREAVQTVLRMEQSPVVALK